MYTFEVAHSPKLFLHIEGLALQLSFEDPGAFFDFVEQMKELEAGILEGLGYGNG